MKAYADPGHPGNGKDYRTGLQCVESGCRRKAGTAWSPHWCQPCNAERMERIDQRFQELVRSVAKKEAEKEDEDEA